MSASPSRERVAAPSRAFDHALAELTFQPLRAFARLQLCALAGAQVTGRRAPGFVAIGPASAGTARAAELVAALAGHQRGTAIVSGRMATAGSLPARTAAALGSNAPYLALSGWELAPRDCHHLAGALLLGEAPETAGAVVFVSLNLGTFEPRLLHPLHMRGAIVLDLTRPRHLPLRRAGRRRGSLPTAMPQLTAPATRQERDWSRRDLGGDHYEVALSVRGRLADARWHQIDVGLLVTLAFGRAALSGGPVDDQTVTATVDDYLSCARTLRRSARG